MHVTLQQPFARNGKVGAFDVVQMKKALNRLGYYQPPEIAGITDFADTAIFTALKEYQSDQGLAATGEAKPDDDTMIALNRDIAVTPPGYYLWRSVEDGKARPAHARFNRTIRMWSDAPDPGEDFNCRCWAEPVAPSVEGDIYEDAIYPTIGPFDLLSGAAILKSAASRVIATTTSRLRLTQKMREAEARDVEWIRNAPRDQLQSKFKHAKDFGIQGNQNKHSLQAYQKALEMHIKSPDTKIIKGTYLRQPATHYYNEKTGLNIIRNDKGEFLSSWKLSERQIERLNDVKNIGGSKK
jgi:peptidoglycan hydrolase-like protein with peptidoglycan-binding domain